MPLKEEQTDEMAEFVLKKGWILTALHFVLFRQEDCNSSYGDGKDTYMSYFWMLFKSMQLLFESHIINIGYNCKQAGAFNNEIRGTTQFWKKNELPECSTGSIINIGFQPALPLFF